MFYKDHLLLDLIKVNQVIDDVMPAWLIILLDKMVTKPISILSHHNVAQSIIEPKSFCNNLYAPFYGDDGPHYHYLWQS